MMKLMTEEYIIRTLQEENLWKEGESDSFTFENWNLTLRKEEKLYSPFIFSVNGVHHNGVSSISRRYTSMEKAFLHILNNFNENANIKNKYETIENYINTNKIVSEETITCAICNQSLDEADVNTVDYPDDVCVNCEKDYKAQQMLSSLNSGSDHQNKTMHLLEETTSELLERILSDEKQGIPASEIIDYTVTISIGDKSFAIQNYSLLEGLQKLASDLNKQHQNL